jgi:hypothetical protein
MYPSRLMGILYVSLECRSHRQSMRNSQDSPPVLARSPEHPRPETESVV